MEFTDRNFSQSFAVNPLCGCTGYSRKSAARRFVCHRRVARQRAVCGRDAARRRAELWRAGVSRIRITRVPGAYEIPMVAARLVENASHLMPFHHLCLNFTPRGQDT
jgi:hypothetical protein